MSRAETESAAGDLDAGRRRRASVGDVRTLVIPAAAGVGNAILFTPTLRQLYRGLGGGKGDGPRIVVIALGRAIAGVFESMPEVAAVRVVRRGGARGFADFVALARRERPDLYLIPFPSNRWQYSVLATLSGARRRVMHGYPCGGWRALHGLPATRVPGVPLLHDTRQNLRLLPALGIEPDFDDAEPRFVLTPADVAAGEALAGAFGVADRPFVALHAGSGATVFGAQKRWPADRFAAVARGIVAGLDRDVLVLEGPDERGIAAQVTALAGNARVRPAPLAGTLGATAALLARSAFYVGNDSALAHLAAAVGRRAVTVFGPTAPETCAPYGNDDLVVRLHKACAPCFTYPFETPYPSVACRHRPYCIESVEVGAVMEAVRRAAQEERSG